MTKRAMLWGAAAGVLLLSATIGCVGQDSTPPPEGSNDLYSVALAVSTVGGLPSCTSALAGTVAHVDSPPSLWRCASGKWAQISCDTSGGGTVAYASTPPTLWACVHSRWTEIALPDAGPPGPAGPPGEAGITPTITVTPEPAGNNCAAGGIRVDVQSAGMKSTSYVCNGLSAEGADAGVDGSDAEAGPNAVEQYVAQYAQAFCSGQGKCCPGYPAAFDQASCAAAWKTVGWENTLPSNAAAYTAGHLTLNASQGASCLSALQNFACTTLGTVTAAQYSAVTTACLGVFSGTIANGSSGCVSSFECINGYCDLPSDGGTIGTCKPLVGSGRQCAAGSDSLDQMCSHVGTNQPNLWCNRLAGGATGTCTAPFADGMTCYDPTVDVSYYDDYGCVSLLCGDDGLCGDPATYPTPPPGFCENWPTDAGAGD
ncbi:MAG: hypothetical protein WBY94_15190 [Polyangiaceae bacterium]